MDVILRESRSAAEEDEELQQGYLSILPYLLHNPCQRGYKVRVVSALLGDLRRGSSSHSNSNSDGSPVSPARQGQNWTEAVGVESPLSSPLGGENAGSAVGVRPSTRRVAEKVFHECQDVLLVAKMSRDG